MLIVSRRNKWLMSLTTKSSDGSRNTRSQHTLALYSSDRRLMSSGAKPLHYAPHLEPGAAAKRILTANRESHCLASHFSKYDQIS
jgi:hypothetical protein